jgi:hypothetical protein
MDALGTGVFVSLIEDKSAAVPDDAESPAGYVRRNDAMIEPALTPTTCTVTPEYPNAAS